MFANGTHVYVQNENAHRAIVRAAFVADLTDVHSISHGPDVFYVVELLRPRWLGGTSCQDGLAYVRHLVVHHENVEIRHDCGCGWGDYCDSPDRIAFCAAVREREQANF